MNEAPAKVCLVAAFGLSLVITACRGTDSSSEAIASAPRISQEPAPPPIPTASSQQSDETTSIADGMVDGDRLTYGDYQVEKLKKRVRVPPDGFSTEVYYVVLRQRGNVVASYDGVYSGFGNAAAFGLFELLGGKTKQLIVSLDVPRGGRQWIVDLGSKPRLLFDGDWYGAGRETPDMRIVDIDKDGRFEIHALIPAFYMAIERLPISDTPLPWIIFGFDERTQKYVPANQRFEDYALASARRERQVLASGGGSMDLPGHLDVLLDYVYARQQEEAWEFFRQNYRGDDGNTVDTKIRGVLKDQPTYLWLYPRAGSRRP